MRTMVCKPYKFYNSSTIRLAQTAFWNLSALRQTTRIREKYLTAVLRQEVGWFDKNPSGELTTRIAR